MLKLVKHPTVPGQWNEAEADLLDLVNPLVPLATLTDNLLRTAAISLLTKVILD